MTALLEDRAQLAGPEQLDALPPTLLRRSIRPFLISIPEDSEAEVPGFVLDARHYVERYPTSPTALTRLAQAELAAGDKKAAAKAALAALKEMDEPDAGPALASAIVLVECDQPKEAETALTKIRFEEGPIRTFVAALAADRGDVDRALELIATEESAEALNLRAWLKLGQGNYAEAIRWYRRALRVSGPTAVALTNIGYAHAALGHRDRAIKDTLQALKLNPTLSSRIGLNLATYYAAGGEGQAALRLLRQLQTSDPDETDLWFAEARLHLWLDDPREALRVLRRVRTSKWAHLSPQDSAELTANLAFVNWHLKKLGRKDAAQQVLHELERTEYSSVAIAEMLPALLSDFSDAKVFKTALARTRQTQPDETLFSLEIHLAVLEHEFSRAASLAARWAVEETLNPLAASRAVFLLADLSADPAQAVSIGLPALERMPASRNLANNVAYALAIAGQVDKAAEVLPEGDDTPQLIATRGLIAIRQGDQTAGLKLYRAASALANKRKDQDLAALVAVHAQMAVACFGDGEVDSPELPSTAPSDGWHNDPRFAIALEMFERIGLPRPALFD